MDKKKRNVAALGMLTILAIAVFFWGFYFLLNNPVFQGGMDLVVAMPNGAGLKRGNPVQLQGVPIGSVKQVRLVTASSVIAELRLTHSVQLPADTRARILSDVFGAHIVELVPGAAMVYLESGDTIRGMTAPALTEIAGELSTRATGILTRADSLLSPATVRDLQATAAVLPSSAVELRAAFTELKLASAALRRTALEVEGAKTGESMRQALARVDESALAIKTAVGTLDRSILSLERSLGTLESVFRKIDGGQGTLGRLINDSTLYFELNGAARELRVLAADVRARPRRYINLEIF